MRKLVLLVNQCSSMSFCHGPFFAWKTKAFYTKQTRSSSRSQPLPDKNWIQNCRNNLHLPTLIPSAALRRRRASQTGGPPSGQYLRGKQEENNHFEDDLVTMKQILGKRSQRTRQLGFSQRERFLSLQKPLAGAAAASLSPARKSRHTDNVASPLMPYFGQTDVLNSRIGRHRTTQLEQTGSCLTWKDKLEARISCPAMFVGNRKEGAQG